MFTLSFTSIVAIIIFLFVFRRPVKQLTTDLPDVVSNLIEPAVIMTGQLKPTAMVCSMETNARLITRAKKAAEQLENSGNKSVEALYKEMISK